MTGISYMCVQVELIWNHISKYKMLQYKKQTNKLPQILLDQSDTPIDFNWNDLTPILKNRLKISQILMPLLISVHTSNMHTVLTQQT